MLSRILILLFCFTFFGWITSYAQTVSTARANTSAIIINPVGAGPTANSIEGIFHSKSTTASFQMISPGFYVVNNETAYSISVDYKKRPDDRNEKLMIESLIAVPVNDKPDTKSGVTNFLLKTSLKAPTHTESGVYYNACNITVNFN